MKQNEPKDLVPADEFIRNMEEQLQDDFDDVATLKGEYNQPPDNISEVNPQKSNLEVKDNDGGGLTTSKRKLKNDSKKHSSKPSTRRRHIITSDNEIQRFEFRLPFDVCKKIRMMAIEQGVSPNDIIINYIKSLS